MPLHSYVLSIWHCKFHLSILYFGMYLHILLCTSIWQYYILYSAINMTFRLLWWCFVLCQCKVLYPIVQFYILLCTKICCHPRLDYFRNFFILFCVPVLWSVSFCEVVLCLHHILHGTQWTKLDGWAGEWVLFSATLPFPAIRCPKWRTIGSLRYGHYGLR